MQIKKNIEARKINFYKYFPEFSWHKDKLIEMKLLNNEYNKPFCWKGKITNLLEYFNWIQEKNNPPHYPGGYWAFIADIFIVKGKPLKPKNMARLYYKQDCTNYESNEFKQLKGELDAYIKSIEKQVKKEYAEVEEQKRRRMEASERILDSLPLLVEFIKSQFKDNFINTVELKKKMVCIVNDLDICIQLDDQTLMRKLGIKK